MADVRARWTLGATPRLSSRGRKLPASVPVTATEHRDAGQQLEAQQSSRWRTVTGGSRRLRRPAARVPGERSSGAASRPGPLEPRVLDPLGLSLERPSRLASRQPVDFPNPKCEAKTNSHSGLPVRFGQEILGATTILQNI